MAVPTPTRSDGNAVQAPPVADPSHPRLAVLIVVDQLPEYLLERYADVFTGGFRRLLDQGHRFTEASHAHAVTETAVGHATLATGVPPSTHGIVANEWRVAGPDGSRAVYAVADSTARILGEPGMPGRSPANLEHSGLADWILAADPRARVVSASAKDRAAITMGGKSPEAEVYWIADGKGKFVTSTYYTHAVPVWVQRVNREVMPDLYTDSVWASRVPAKLARLSRPDTAAFEKDGVHTAFPHRFREEVPGGDSLALKKWIDRTPVPDEAVLRFALAAVNAEYLGRRGVTDLLALSFSQTDYVGHDYGPLSREQLDNLLRLDERLGRLFDALDQQVGRGNWVAALSADHGVEVMPEVRSALGEPGYRIGKEDLQAVVAALKGAIQEGTPEDVMRRAIVDAVDAVPHVAALYRDEQLADAPIDSFEPLYRNSFYRGRWPGLLSQMGFEIRWDEGTLFSVKATGTTHGSPYWYDRHVPLVFLGGALSAGASGASVHTWDVAPTLAALAGITPPPDLEGRILLP